MKKRAQEAEAEALDRYRRIGNLWTGYYAQCSEGPEVFGREFFHAVGELLQGRDLEQLELMHISTNELEEVVFAKKTKRGRKKRKTG